MKKLEALQEKPWYMQLAAFGVVGILLYACFWYFVTKGTRDETTEIEARIGELQMENAKAQAAEQRLNDFRASYARVQADYDDLKALLPEHRELTMVLASIHDRARGQLAVTKFMPKADEQQDFYSSKLIEVGVSGSYNKLGNFFSQMASYQRIVSITDFKLTGLDKKKSDDQDFIQKGRTLNAEFKLKAYYASPDRLQNVTPVAGTAGVKSPDAAAAAPAAAN